MGDLLIGRGLPPTVITTREEARVDLELCLVRRGVLERELETTRPESPWSIGESPAHRERRARVLHTMLCALAIRVALAHDWLARGE